MFGKKLLCFICILLQIHCGFGIPQQPAQLDVYSNSRSFPQLYQKHQQMFDASQNYYVPNSHNLQQQYSNYAVASAAQPYGYDANGTPNHQVLYQYTTPPTTHSQLWSSAPIVVANDAAAVLAHNDQISSDYKNDLQTRSRNSKALPPLTYNSNQPGRQQQLPSNYNYPNPAVYHNSDVWRQQQQQHLLQHQHSINTSPQSREENSWNYNRHQQQYPEDVQPPPPLYHRQQPQEQQQQHHHQQPQQQQHRQHQLYASNTDLNYLEANPMISQTAHSSARKVGDKSIAADYSEHFKDYLRKNPRRIKPIY